MKVLARDDFPDAVEAIRRSRVWAIVDSATRVWRSSASDSRCVAAMTRVSCAFEALPDHDRVRAIAIVAAVAAAAHALLLGLIPWPLRPAVPRVYWMVVSVTAAVVAVRKSGGKNQASDA